MTPLFNMVPNQHTFMEDWRIDMVLHIVEQCHNKYEFYRGLM